jgi:hypothetical protein
MNQEHRNAFYKLDQSKTENEQRRAHDGIWIAVTTLPVYQGSLGLVDLKSREDYQGNIENWGCDKRIKDYGLSMH